jgi:hypothetical protein
MSDAEEVEKWKDLCARVAELRIVSDLARQRVEGAKTHLQHLRDKVIEAQQAGNATEEANKEILAFLPEHMAIFRAHREALERHIEAIETAQKATPLSVNKTEFEAKLHDARRQGKAPHDDIETPLQ